eukprot:m.23628 g.23628  ORF g.23628 m.23628 type:complete len:624 (-) comp5565_c0_seq1:37-1908(-)
MKMKCIILAAGHTGKLESDIACDGTGRYIHLKGVPKALLPGPDGQSPLDRWWHCISRSSFHFSDVYLLTNAETYKHYERWATTNRFERRNIINDGTTAASGSRGGVDGLDLVIRGQKVADDVLIVAGDMMFEPQSFDLTNVVKYFNSRVGNLLCYYQMSEDEEQSSRGVVELDRSNNKVTALFEKPQHGVTNSRSASVVLYCIQKNDVGKITSFASNARMHQRKETLGSLMASLVEESCVNGLKLPDQFDLIGNVGLSDYERCLQRHSKFEKDCHKDGITHRAFARVGIMGNPSDGFNGKTISFSIKNFHAEATITEHSKLVLEPHPLNDPTRFGSLEDLNTISRQEGYQGGLRLMQATCKRFYEYCLDSGISLAKKNFKLTYDTNIPRQVGLAGSSAICTAVLQCLMGFFGVTERDIPKQLQANFVLSVEVNELGINAGLQDRVIQAYEGMVFMDFSKDVMNSQGYGNYKYINVDEENPPQFWLAYLSDPSDSGKIHSDIRRRFDNGDDAVVSGMQQFASFTDDALVALEKGDYAALADLMDKNFDLRRELYTDKCLGDANLKMVEIARKHGSAVKFPGSGGAVVGLSRNPEKLWELQQELESNNFVFVEVIPNWSKAAQNV